MLSLVLLALGGPHIFTLSSSSRHSCDDGICDGTSEFVSTCLEDCGGVGHGKRERNEEQHDVLVHVAGALERHEQLLEWSRAKNPERRGREEIGWENSGTVEEHEDVSYNDRSEDSTDNSSGVSASSQWPYYALLPSIGIIGLLLLVSLRNDMWAILSDFVAFLWPCRTPAVAVAAVAVELNGAVDAKLQVV